MFLRSFPRTKRRAVNGLLSNCTPFLCLSHSRVASCAVRRSLTVRQPTLLTVYRCAPQLRCFTSSTNNSDPKKAASSGTKKDASPRLKLSAKPARDSANGRIGASQIELTKLKEDSQKRRWFSANTAFRLLLSYLMVSLGCLGYVYYKGIPVSRLMYAQPFLLSIDPEKAHRIAVKAAQFPRWARRALGMVNSVRLSPGIGMKVWQLEFASPIGLAAGFDKHGECVDGMLDMGFGCVEVGSVTPLPQNGNPRPRVFRLPKDRAVINRYGFPSHGHAAVRRRLESRKTKSVGLMGVNLGKNETSVGEDQIVDDYVKGVESFVHLADYLVVNVSCPNTEGLLEMQRREHLHNILRRVKDARDDAYNASLDSCKPPPLLVKIGPDLSDEQLADVCGVVQSLAIDGIIVTNTTTSREGLRSKHRGEKGGLSGRPLFEKSNEVLKKVYRLTNGDVPLVGVGGVMDAGDVYRKMKCGATLVQVYTGFAYNGPVMVKRILQQLAHFSKADGFDQLQQCVGFEVRQQMAEELLAENV